jgi:hypothetical protein
LVACDIHRQSDQAALEDSWYIHNTAAVMNNKTSIPLLFALTLSACGSSPAPVVAKPVAPAQTPRVEVAAAQLDVPLNDAAPKDMSARIHAENLEMSWKNAERLLRVIGVGSPGLAPELLAMGLLGPSVASVIDLSGPVDLAFFGAEFDRFAVAIPIAPEMQPRLGKIFKLRQHRGLWKIVAGDDEEESVPGSLGACAFVGVEDESGARVVCAGDEALLDSAGLYLGRTVTREARDGDVRLEIVSQQLFARIADEASDGNTNDWAEAAGEQYALSFFRDIEHLSLVGSWGKSNIEAEAVLGFRKDATGFAGALSGRVPLQSPSTASFLRMPKDAVIAVHGHASHAQSIAPMRDEFLRALKGDMESDGYDSGLLETFNTQLSKLIFTGGSYSFAYGIDRTAAEKALAAYSKDKKKPALRAAAYRSLHGWSMFAVDESPERWTRGIEEIVRAGNELDKKRNGGVVPSSGPITGKKADDRQLTTLSVVAAPALLPKGSLHVEIRSRPLKTDAPPASLTHLYVVPDGGRTWIGISEDEAPMLARLRAAREGTADQTIAGVPELANTVSQGAVAAGFFSLAGETFLFLDDDSDEKLDKAVKEIDSLATLPGRGDGIIPWQVVSEETQNGGNRSRMKAKLSLAVLGDIAEMAKR